MKTDNKRTMISVEKALGLVLGHAVELGTEEIPFEQATGRVLKEDILADRDMPPFNRVSMDGIAIACGSFDAGKRKFKIEGVQAAGSEQLLLQDSGNCIEAMTGAILPAQADAVIPYELLQIEDGEAMVNTEEIQYFQNIHRKGLDRKRDDVLIAKHTRLTPAEIGVLATVGKSRVRVAKLPSVAVISTGDELVDVHEIPKPFQIRKSNVHTVAAVLEQWKIKAEIVHLKDEQETLRKSIAELLKEHDVLIFSGAVSKGKFDFLPGILEELGVEKLFHRVRQRPGKPFWFGKKEDKTVFAFPGNPVSTFVSCLKYFEPWLMESSGLPYRVDAYAVLAENFEFRPDLTYFLQVKLVNEQGVIKAWPITGNGSGDLANLSGADAFLELPSGRSSFRKGEAFPYMSYRK